MNRLKIANKYIVIGPYSRIDIAAAFVAIGIGTVIVVSGGEWIYKTIGLFGVLAIIFRIRSKVPFVLVFICIASMPIVQLFEQKPLLENLAVSAFYFLLISISLLALESQNRTAFATTKSVPGGIRPHR